MACLCVITLSELVVYEHFTREIFLQKHYHPAVRQFSDHLLIGAPSQGAGQLPVEMSRK